MCISYVVLRSPAANNYFSIMYKEWIIRYQQSNCCTILYIVKLFILLFYCYHLLYNAYTDDVNDHLQATDV